MPVERFSKETNRHASMGESLVLNFRLASPQPPSVVADVAYLAPTNERPFNYMYDPPVGSLRQNCHYVHVPMSIADGRCRSESARIDVEGFELWDAPTSVSDFGNEDAVRTRYYAEVIELAKLITGADHAYVFDHQIRRREAGRPALSFGRDLAAAQPGAAGRVHNDYSEDSGRKRFALIVPDQIDRVGIKRFAIVNIWRSIGGKIADTPLALCDARTVSIDDLVASDILYPDRKGEIYLVHHSSRHRWTYFSAMNRHEALVFKQYDSQVNGTARFTPHTAFDLPNIPPEAPLRHSIEVRCLVTFD